MVGGSALQHFVSSSMKERRGKSCEEFNPTSSDCVCYPSSDILLSELVECLKKINKLMQKKNIYVEAPKEMCEDVRMENMSK